MKNYIRIKGSILISNKKSQAAMEFLMSYGWALLVILLVIAALAYFGMLNPDRFLPDKITVSDNRIQLISTGSNRIIVKNVGADTLTNLRINMTNHDCIESAARTISPGSLDNFYLSCSDMPTSGSRLKGDIKITYTTNVYSESVTKVVNANYAVRGNYFKNRGLIAYFPFDKDMLDYSGINIAPTATNQYYVDNGATSSCSSDCAVLTSGIKNNALYLKTRPTATECNVLQIDTLNVNTAGSAKNTVAFMMYWDGTDIQMPFGWNAAYDLWFAGGSFGFNTGASDVTGISNSGLANKWVHVVAVFSNSPTTINDNKLYINGEKQAISLRVNGPATLQSVTTSLRIGQWLQQNGLIYCFKEGKIDEFMVFNRELNDDEAKALYLASKN
jgi:hypothetical protein